MRLAQCSMVMALFFFTLTDLGATTRLHIMCATTLDATTEM